MQNGLSIIIIEYIFRSLGQVLSKLVRYSVNQRKLDFIHILPLFHFVHGLSEPYKPLSPMEHASAAWWGFPDEITAKIDDAKKIYNK
jgi:hypothetical protein